MLTINTLQITATLIASTLPGRGIPVASLGDQDGGQVHKGAAREGV